MTSPKTVPAALDELGRYTDTVLPYAPEEIDPGPSARDPQRLGPAEAARPGGERGRTSRRSPRSRGCRTSTTSSRAGSATPTGRRRTSSPRARTMSPRCPRRRRSSSAAPASNGSGTAAPIVPGEHALVNLNFTFHVLTDQRDAWLDSTRDALRRAGVAGLVSTHPAERGRVHRPAGGRQAVPSRDHKGRHPDLRFSTVPFEAMARGVPFVYHNPHGERFPTFTEAGRGVPGVFVRRRTDRRRWSRRSSWRDDYRSRCETFFAQQVSVDPDRTSAERAADVIVKLSH